jgi:CBS domain-containing protein
MTRTVADVMVRTRRPLWEEATFHEIAQALVDENTSSLPVVDGAGRVLGMVSEADLILRDESFGAPWRLRPTSRSIRRKVDGTTATELMTSPAIIVSPDTELTTAALRMRKHGIKCLPVCDAERHLLGTLSRRDLLLEFTRPDEGIAGDLAALWGRLGVSEHDIRYIVADGVVTLEGRIEHRLQAEEIVRRVHEVPGTVGVIERLTWEDADDAYAHSPLAWMR